MVKRPWIYPSGSTPESHLGSVCNPLRNLPWIHLTSVTAALAVSLQGKGLFEGSQMLRRVFRKASPTREGFRRRRKEIYLQYCAQVQPHTCFMC